MDTQDNTALSKKTKSKSAKAKAAARRKARQKKKKKAAAAGAKYNEEAGLEDSIGEVEPSMQIRKLKVK